MQIPFIHGLSGADMLKAICWTLVHSLWQGVLLAIAGGFVIMFTKKRHPSIRYNLLSVFFLVFILSALYTFTVQLRHAAANRLELAAAVSENVLEDPAVQSKSVSPVINDFSNSFTYYFDKNAPLVVLLWFIILSARLIKMFSGLLYINRIRTQKISLPAREWQTRLFELQSILLINKRVQLLESGIIKVPMAVGWLKPAILIPAGLFTHLSNEQLEAIILHELAHIKRKDYFVNLLQSFAETIFFFNPAVLWISSLIREERENCCDDMAISITKNKRKFINALVSFQEYNVAEYAMPFPGKKNHLLNRVQRIIYNTNNTLNVMERAGIATCCLAMVLLSAFINPQNGQHALIKDIFQIESFANDSTTFASDTTKDESVINVQPGNKKTITAASKFAPANLKTATKINEPKPEKAIEIGHKTVSKKDTIPTLNYKLNINLNSNINLAVNTVTKLNNLVKLDSILILKKILSKLTPIEIRLPKFSMNMNYNINIDSSFYNKIYKVDSSTINARPKNKPKPNAATQPKDDPQAKPRPQVKDNPMADPVIISLIKEKIINEAVIKNKEDFYYILNNRELIVQGVKQSEDIYKRYKQKFVSPTGQTTRSYVWKN